MKRDINKYWEKYKEIYGFEELMKVYRERKALEFLNTQKASNVLDIGSGLTPLFPKYDNFNKYVIVEPGKDAYENSLSLSKELDNVYCIQDYFENSFDKLKNYKFDCILATGVLHVTETPSLFLKTIGKLSHKETSIYLCVPNANSLHRVLAKEMGIIQNIYARSQRNEAEQQNGVFDKNSLMSIIKDNLPEADIIECESFFIKPFTHDQMMQCLNTKIIDNKVIEGFYKISSLFPEYGSELYCTFKINKYTE